MARATRKRSGASPDESPNAISTARCCGSASAPRWANIGVQSWCTSCVRQLHLRLDSRDLGDSKPRGLSDGVPHERRLPDSRLTMDDERPALALAHLIQQPVQHVALAAPATEQRLTLGGHCPPERNDQGLDPGLPWCGGDRQRPTVGGVAAPADDTTHHCRVAIVTRGSRGLGRDVMRTLAGRGYAVVVYYVRDQRGAEAAVEEVLATNGSALTVRGHVADELDVERLFAETIKAFGGVDVVVHAGGQISLGPGPTGGLDTFGAPLPTSALGTFVVNRTGGA